MGFGWHSAGIPFPRTVPIIEGVLALLGMAAVRPLSVPGPLEMIGQSASAGVDKLRRVLIVGAGEAGIRIGWEIRRRPGSGFLTVGFLDDAPAKAQLNVAGTQILGRIEDLPRVVRDHGVDQVFITMPSASGARRAGSRNSRSSRESSAGSFRGSRNSWREM